jgi:hypothetical protein
MSSAVRAVSMTGSMTGALSGRQCRFGRNLDARDGGRGEVGAEQRGEAVVVGGGGEPGGDLVKVVGRDGQLRGDLVPAGGQLPAEQDSDRGVPGAAAGCGGGCLEGAVKAQRRVGDGQGAGLAGEPRVPEPLGGAVRGRRDSEHAQRPELVAAA